MNAFRLDHLEQGTAGSADSMYASHHRRVRRTRRFTLCTVFVVLLALVVHVVVRAGAARAHHRAVLEGEQCWPLATQWVPAVVMADDARSVLWFPTYARDEGPGDLVRTREKSIFCRDVKTRIRQKRATVRHGVGRHTSFSDKEAVCVMHYADFFKTNTC